MIRTFESVKMKLNIRILRGESLVYRTLHFIFTPYQNGHLLNVCEYIYTLIVAFNSSVIYIHSSDLNLI